MSDNLQDRILNAIRAKMVPKIFDAWLKNSEINQHGKTISIILPGQAAHAWVVGRLKKQIELAIREELKSNVTIEYRWRSRAPVSPQDLETDSIEMEAAYQSLYNQMVKPKRVFVDSQYFRQKWVPLLGTSLAWLVIELRQRCYWNKTTGEKRDRARATYKELAMSIGVTERTVSNLLNPKDPEKQKMLDEFIIKKQIIRGICPNRGHIINYTTEWVIRMDDPLTPEDKQRLHAQNKRSSA